MISTFPQIIHGHFPLETVKFAHIGQVSPVMDLEMDNLRNGKNIPQMQWN